MPRWRSREQNLVGPRFEETFAPDALATGGAGVAATGGAGRSAGGSGGDRAGRGWRA